MRYIITVSLFLVSTLLSGCTIEYKVPPSVPATPQPPVQTRPPPQAPVPQAEQRPLTISETIQICQDIQKDKAIIIGCEVRYVEGKPSMIVAFPDVRTMNSYWNTMINLVTLPFCMAANSANRQAFLVVMLNDVKQARLYACETRIWGDWYDYGSTGTTRY